MRALPGADMKELLQENCIDFTARLASAAPTPGGGGAAALTGALAAALCSMAAELTAGRKKYADRAERLEAVCTACEALRMRLLSLVEEDAAAFAPLAAAYALPKDAPDTAAALRAASLAACAAPLAMLEACAECAALLEQMRDLVSPLLLSDVGCGAALCGGALESAAMNVFVNVRGLAGDPEAETLHRRARAILDDALPRTRALSAWVTERLEN